MDQTRRDEIADDLHGMTIEQRQEYILKLPLDEQYEWICGPKYTEAPERIRQRKENIFTLIVVLSFIFGLFLSYIL